MAVKNIADEITNVWKHVSISLNPSCSSVLSPTLLCKRRKVTSRAGERSLWFFLCSSSSNRSSYSSSSLLFFKYQNRRTQISLTQEQRRQRRQSSKWRFFFFGSLVWWIFVVWWCFSSLGFDLMMFFFFRLVCWRIFALGNPEFALRKLILKRSISNTKIESLKLDLL